jgi:hypothetical protein
MTVAIGWPHDGGETAGAWPHEAGDWQPVCKSSPCLVLRSKRERIAQA